MWISIKCDSNVCDKEGDWKPLSSVSKPVQQRERERSLEDSVGGRSVITHFAHHSEREIVNPPSDLHLHIPWGALIQKVWVMWSLRINAIQENQEQRKININVINDESHPNNLNPYYHF